MTPLLISGIFEIAMVYCLNKSAGFKQKKWGALVIVFATLSFLCLSAGMDVMEAGVAYSIWVALGSIGSLMIGVLVFHDTLNWQQVLCIIGIIVAIIGLKFA